MCIENYFNNVVSPCRNCDVDPSISEFFTFEKLPPFVGAKSPKVLIVGHSPTVRTGSNISSTLDLNRNSLLQRYIVNEILVPLGVTLEDCIATNLVKCHTRALPEDIELTGKKSFMPLAFGYCKSHLIQEVKLLKPKLIISLSERVSTLLQQVFIPETAPKKMKQIFGTIQTLEVAGEPIPWVPVVHLPKPKVRAHYFPEQTTRLQSISGKIQI